MVACSVSSFWVRSASVFSNWDSYESFPVVDSVWYLVSESIFVAYCWSFSNLEAMAVV